jgi:hypothetical protein
MVTNNRWIRTVTCSVVAVSSCAVASELPKDFEAAETAATKSQLKHSSYSDNVLQPFFYENVMNRCVQLSFEDKTPFVMVLALDATGKLLKTYENPETTVSRCINQAASKTAFPKPPAAPFFAHFDMRFGKQR